jgi:hypothetical protein
LPANNPDPVIVEFPLRGEGWVAVNSPGDRVPSHGTDMLGQRYAYDFVKVDGRSISSVSPKSMLHSLVLGVPTRECHAWGQEIHAPLDGEVLVASDGMGEPGRVHPVRDLRRVIWNGLTFKPSKLAHILGNHVVLRCGENLYAAFAHIAPGTVAVTPGQAVLAGHVLGKVGHTGNSTSPHLHFQLMDSADPLQARGIPCAFREYDLQTAGGWRTVTKAIPRRKERVRLA